MRRIKKIARSSRARARRSSGTIGRATRAKFRRAACSRRSASTDPHTLVSRMSIVRWSLLLLVACSSPQPVASSAKPIDTPKLVDSHVHLAYYPVASALAEHGIVAAVDLAAPESALGKAYPLRVIQSGPMLTRPSGYPLDSWGKDGFGIGCADRACVTSAVERLANKGARVIKIALDDNGLDPALAAVATKRAHELGM